MPFIDNPVVGDKNGPWWCEEWNPEGLRILIKCPNHHLWALINHKIDKDGRVSPQVKCTKCGWMESLHLDNWNTLQDR